MRAMSRDAAADTPAGVPPQARPQPHSGWYVGALYAFFVFSALSIVGSSLALLVMAVALLVLRPPLPMQRGQLGRAMLPFLLLFASIITSALVNPHPLDNFEAAFPYRLAMLPLLLLLVLPRTNVPRLLRVLCAMVIFVGLYGVLQFYTGLDPLYPNRGAIDPFGAFFRARGGFSVALTYSGYLVMLAPLLATLAFAENGWWRLYWLLGSLSAVVGIAVSLSRSAVVGLAAGALLLLFRWNRRLATAMVGAALLALVAVAATGPALMLQLEGNPLVRGSVLVQRFVLLDPSSDKSAMDRLLIWHAGLLGFLDRPVFGFGLGNHDPYLGPYQHRVLNERGTPNYQFSVGFGAPLHNMYVRTLFDLGLVGFLTYLWLWYAVLSRIAHGLRALPADARWQRALLWGLAAGLVSSMASGCFEDNFFDAEVQTLILALMALTLHAVPPAPAPRPSEALPATGAPAPDRAVPEAD